MNSLVRKKQGFLVKIAEYCQKNYNCLKRDFRLFMMRKLARIETIRNLITALSKSNKNYQKLGQDNYSIFPDLNVDEAAAALRKDGYYIGLKLPQDIVQELREFAHSSTCYGDRNPEYSFNYAQKEQVEAKVGKKFMLGSYMDSTDTCPAFQKLKNDPGLLAIAARYLGTEPNCVENELCWSFPVSATLFEQLKAAQVFHYDIDDYRSIKFFFYLTDVDASGGPHVCIRGTHKNKKLLHQVIGQRCASIDDQKLIDCYGAEKVTTILGEAGSGFVGDTFCFHKGTLPIDNERLLLQLEFAIYEYEGVRYC
ncbi:MAG: hypothetical protein F6J86_12705 [Symploca sp. SIO1B1]|nr:hypothetical protein [Symploca sp. SIO1C2]NER94679.1 hypothetical protein [Symploca sp. SIO1B1]